MCTYFIYVKKELIKIDRIVKKDDRLFLYGKYYRYEMDETGFCLILISVNGNIKVNFEKVKTSPTYNKGFFARDSAYYICVTR